MSGPTIWDMRLAGVLLVVLMLAGCSAYPEAGGLVTQDDQSTQVDETTPAPAPQAVYTVTGDGTVASEITYSTGVGNQAQAANAALPWTFTVPAEDGSFVYYGVLAQDGNGTTITCTITVDGSVTSTVTSTGKFAIAQCSSH